MNSIVALPIAAAVPTAAPAMPPGAEQSADPIFAAIDAYHRADAALIPVDGNIPDELMDRYSDAYEVVIQTRPTTPAGLAALTALVREEANQNRTDGSLLPADTLHTLTVTIDDAVRGMSGLRAWSPPNSLPLAPVMPSELDALWRERMELTWKANEKARDYHAALDSLPGWARSGPESIDSSGHRCGGEVGWPEVAEFELPSGNDIKLIRISPHQIKKEFDLAVGMCGDDLNDLRRQKARETFRQKMRSLIARLRQKRAEEARAGLPELDKEIDRLCDQRFDLDERIKVLEPSVNLAVAGMLIEVSFYVRLGESVDDPDNELRAALIPIRALHPLLTGAVRETVDIMFNNPTVPLEDLDVMRA